MKNVLFVMLAVLLIPFRAAACSCSSSTVQEIFQNVDVVFSAKVIKSQTAKLTDRFRGETITLHTMSVSSVWKGDVPATVAFYRYSLEDSCRVAPFKNGDEWLIYAYKVNKWLTDELWKQIQAQGIQKPAFVYLTSICLRTRGLSVAQVDVKELGQPKPPSH